MNTTAYVIMSLAALSGVSAFADCGSDVNAAATSVAQRSQSSDEKLELMSTNLIRGEYDATYLYKDGSGNDAYVVYIVNVKPTAKASCQIVSFVEKERFG